MPQLLISKNGFICKTENLKSKVLTLHLSYQPTHDHEKIANMASPDVLRKLEEPVADGFGNTATATVTSVKLPSAPRKKKVIPPVWGTPEWEEWQKSRLVDKVIKVLFPKNKGVCLDPLILEGLGIWAEGQVDPEPSPLLTWAPKKPKKGVSWVNDVPYKHNAAGEIFEGPVSSQLTFDNMLPAL